MTTTIDYSPRDFQQAIDRLDARRPSLITDAPHRHLFLIECNEVCRLVIDEDAMAACIQFLNATGCPHATAHRLMILRDGEGVSVC